MGKGWVVHRVFVTLLAAFALFGYGCSFYDGWTQVRESVAASPVSVRPGAPGRPGPIFENTRLRHAAIHAVAARAWRRSRLPAPRLT